MANLVVTYSDQGKYEEAEVLQLKLLDLCKKVLRLDHPKTLSSISDLAAIYVSQGKYEEAEQLEMEMSKSGKPENLAN